MALENSPTIDLNLPDIAPSASPTEAFDRQFSQVNTGITFNNPQPVIGPAIPSTTPDSININDNLVGNQQTGPVPGVKNTSGGTVDFVKAVNSYMGQADTWAKDKYKYGRTYSYGAGYRNMNFERYYNHPQFKKLGFSPYRDNEQLYNENSSWLDDFQRMGTQWGKLFTTGLGSSLFLVDDDEAAEIMEKGMAIGSTSKEGAGAWLTNFGLNSAYTMGIMTEIVIEDIGLAALEGVSLGTATPLVGAELARQSMLIGKGIRAVEKTKDVLKTLTNYNKAKELFTLGKLAEKTVDFAKFANPFERTFEFTANLAKNTNSFDKLNNIAKTAKGFSSFYKDVREISLAVEEGGMEAATASNEYHQRLIDEYYAKNGTMPEGKDAESIYEKSKSVRASVQMWNNMIIYATNKLTIGKLLDGLPTAGLIAKGLEETSARQVRKTAVKEVLEKGALELAEVPFSKKAAKFLVSSPYVPWSKSYIVGNLGEALQENAQEVIQKGVIAYHDKIDKDPSQAGFWEGVNHLGAALGTQWSGEGLNTFMSGFLMGSVAGGVQTAVFKGVEKIKSFDPVYKAQFETAKQNAIKREDSIINAANAIAKDAMNIGQHNADNAAAARNYAAEMDNAVEENDAFKFNNMKDELAASNFYTLASTGKMNLITDHFDGMLKASNEELAEAYGKKPEEGAVVRKRLETLKERAENFQKKYDTAVKEFPNPNDPTLFDPKKQPEVYKEVLTKYNAWNESVKTVVIAAETAERINGRIVSIANEFSKVSPWIETRRGATISNTAGINDAMAFIDKYQRATEIQTLEAEVEALKDGTPEQKQQATLKEKKINSYKGWANLLDSFNRALLSERKGKGDKAVLNELIEKLYDQFNDHIQIVAEENGGTLKNKEADKAFKKILDFYMLETDSQNITNAINVLSNPEYFNRYYKAEQVVQAKREADKEKNLKESFIEFDKLKKTNDFLNELYDLGLWILPEEIEDFKKDPKLVTYYDKNNKEVVKLGKEKYAKIEAIVNKYFPAKEEIKTEETEETKLGEKKEGVQEPAKPKAPKVVTPNVTLEQLDQIPELKNILIKLYKNQFVRESKGLSDEIIFNTPKFKNFIQTSGVALDQINKYNLANTTQTAKTENEVQVVFPEEIDEAAWKDLIDKAVSERELDKIMDQIDAVGQMPAGLIQAISKKRDTFKEAPVEEVTEQAPVVSDVEAKKAAIERKSGESSADFINRLFENNYFTEVDGKQLFALTGGRWGVVVNVNGINIPFYQSTSGTDTKIAGQWYPFFGDQGNWVIKGNSDDSNVGYGFKAIQDVQDFLNKNIKETEAIALSNLVPTEVNQNKEELRKLNESQIKANNNLSISREATAKRLSKLLGYTVEEARKTKSDAELFKLASKKVFAELDALEGAKPAAKPAVTPTPETSKESEAITERTYYQGSAEKTDEREFNYFTTNEEEAKDYGGKVRTVKVESNNPLNYYANRQVVDEFNAQNQGQVPEEFRGKLIYATPGSGKTTISKTNKNIVDADQLIIEEMAKLHPDFTRNTGETDQEFIGRYTKTYIRAKATINQNVRNRIEELKAEGKTIFTGTLAFADQVDVAFSLKKDDPRLSKRFSSTKEANEFFAKEKEAFDNADKEIKKLEKPLESLFTTAKRFDILDNSPEGLATQEAFFRFVKAKGYDAIDFSTPGQIDSLYLVSLTNEIIKPAEKKTEEVKQVKKEEVKQQVVVTPVLISALDELNSLDDMNEFFGDLLTNKEAKEKYGLSDASNAVILKLQSEARKRFFKKKDFRSAVKGTVGILATGEKFVITNKSKNAVKYRILDQDNFPTGEEKTLDKETFKTAVDILYKDGMELQEGLFEQIAEENKNTSNQNTEASTSVLTKEKIEKALEDAQTMSKEDRLKKLKDNLGCKK